MLFLLRNIRRKLFAGNKVITYLMYSIGEIFLVVVGILIAISLDNWNQERKDFNTTQKLLSNLRAELELNIQNLQSDSIIMAQAANSGLTILKIINGKQPPDASTVDSLTYLLIATPTTSLSQGTVLDIINTGKIDLIRNDTLRSTLLALGSKVENLVESERLANELLHTGLVPYLYEHFAFAKMDSKFQQFKREWPPGRFDSDLNYMFSDRKYETMIDDCVYRNLKLLGDMNQLATEIRMSLDLVKKELVR